MNLSVAEPIREADADPIIIPMRYNCSRASVIIGCNILPLATIVLTWSYLVRNFMIGAMQEEHIFAKRAIGISKRKIVYSHALRNAAPIITVLALSVSGSLGGPS